jgi:quinol monooxygenase YgiN
MIHVLAIITAKPGMRAQILEAFHANIPAVLAEDGCIEYGPVVDTASSPAKFGDDTFVVVEKWASADHLKAHAASPHMAAYGAKTREMVASRTIHIMQNG